MILVRYLRHCLIISLFFSLTTPLFAQQPGDPGEDPDNPIPIDGGLSLLLAAGAAYGAKKVYNFRKEEKKQE